MAKITFENIASNKVEVVVEKDDVRVGVRRVYIAPPMQIILTMSSNN